MNLGYNLYSIDNLSLDQVSLLASKMAPGLNYILAGEEYEEHKPLLTIDLADKISKFCRLTKASKITVVAPMNYREQKYEEFYGVIAGIGIPVKVQWLNEDYNNATDLDRWSKDWVNAIFRRDVYYKNQATQYYDMSLVFKNYMQEKGLQVDLIYNLPVPQNNRFFSAYNKQLQKKGVKDITIHVYCKHLEFNYFNKLKKWVRELKGQGFNVEVGEYSGIELSKYRGLKNSDTHTTWHNAGLQTLSDLLIEDVYMFMLVAIDDPMLLWQNPPIYHVYLVEKETGNITKEIDFL